MQKPVSYSGKYHSRRFTLPGWIELAIIATLAYANLSPLAGMFSVTKIMLY